MRQLAASLSIFTALLLLDVVGQARGAWAEEGGVELPSEIAEVRDKLWSGRALGQTFEVVISEGMAVQTLEWFLAEHPEIPFHDPTLKLGPKEVSGGVTARVLGIRASVRGRGRIALEEGVPVLEVKEMRVLGVKAPELVVDAVQAILDAHFDLSQHPFPMQIDRLELAQGKVTVEGTYLAYQ